MNKDTLNKAVEVCKNETIKALFDRYGVEY